MSGLSIVDMIEHDYKNVLDEFDPTLDDAEIVEMGKSKELISDELYMPIHISRDWVRCYVTTTQPENFRMYVEGKSKRFLLSAKQFGDTFLISTYEDFPAAVQDVKPKRGYIAKVQQKTDLSYLVTLNHCHLCDDHLGFFKCGREHDEREVVAKVVHSVKKYHAINMDFKCLSVTIPAISENGRRKIWCPRSFRKVEPSLPMSADVNEGLFQCPTMGMKFVNKLPEWNSKLESLVLKFQGNRILTASAKNFLLYDEKYSKYDFAEAKVRQTVSRQESRETQQRTSSAGATRNGSSSSNANSNSNNNNSNSSSSSAAQRESDARGGATGDVNRNSKPAAKPAVPRLPILQSLFAGRSPNGTELDDDDDEEDRASARRSRQQRPPGSSSGSRIRAGGAGGGGGAAGGNDESGDHSPSPMSTYRSSDTAGYGGGGLSPPNTNRSVESTGVTPRSSRPFAQQQMQQQQQQSQQQPQQQPPRRKKAPPRPRDAADVAIMQFGKSSSTRFVLDFKYPLSPLQAFGIALSSFSSERIIRAGADKKKY